MPIVQHSNLHGGQAMNRKYPIVASTAFAQGSLTYRANGVLNPCDGSTETTISVFGVCQNTSGADSDADILVTPITQGTLWLIDCTSDTAAAQLLKTHLMTDAVTLANSSTEDATSAAVAFMHELVGATTDKKAIVEFIRINGVVS